MTEEPIEGLEATTDNMRRILGDDGLDRLAEAFGGRRLYVPAAPGPHHPITVAIGADLARKLGEAFHGVDIDIPMLPRTRAEIRRLDALGWTRTRIARELRITERWVYKVLSAEEDLTSRQGRLFG